MPTDQIYVLDLHSADAYMGYRLKWNHTASTLDVMLHVDGIPRHHSRHDGLEEQKVKNMLTTPFRVATTVRDDINHGQIGRNFAGAHAEIDETRLVMGFDLLTETSSDPLFCHFQAEDSAGIATGVWFSMTLEALEEAVRDLSTVVTSGHRLSGR